MNYKPKRRSLKKHKVPEWYQDAKLGIFVHWGLYSVAAFATNVGKSPKEIVKEQGFEAQFKYSAYAEWYMNAIRIEGSPAQEYHKKTYGENSTHDDLVPIFNEEIKKWNPDEMAEVFKKSGARYAVFTTKHHEGFLLWPSKYPNPIKENYMASRNLVGELTEAVRKQGMKMGFYYSGTFDWSFQPDHITDTISFMQNGVLGPEYIKYVNNHWYELIDEYNPIILWNDIGYPPKTNVNEIFAYFYNKNPEGLINDRWLQLPKWLRRVAKLYVPRKILKWATKRAFLKGSSTMPSTRHYDYKTPEYGVFEKISKKKWEQTRGIGNSFGYNQFEKEEDHLTFEKLIYEFVDLVSKNGNLLLNVGPMADGTIPDVQKQRLLELGGWLKINGDAIYGTRPWERAEGKTNQEINVRFTKKENILFAIMLGKPFGSEITITSIKPGKISNIKLLGYDFDLSWTFKNDDLTISNIGSLNDSPAYSFKVSLV